LSEIIVQNDDESKGWPCMNDPWDWHKKDSKIDGSCRTGICFYTSDHTVLRLVVHDSLRYKYVVIATLNPGTNFISWCDETILAHESDYIARFSNKTPWFSVSMDNLGMALTCHLSDAHSGSAYVASPESAPVMYRLRGQPVPPSITIVSQKGTVPSLYLLAKMAGGREGLMFEYISGLGVSLALGKVTYHSLENRLERS
jgi:hypothetical protein